MSGDRLAAWIILLLAAAIGAYMLLNSRPAGAQDGAQHHHPFHRDFYSKWQRPDGMGSCCNARLTGPDGHEEGDCEPSEAHVSTGTDGKPHWFARLPHGGDFIEIPDRRIIHERNPEQGGPDGHLCWTANTGVLCFVPPSTGM
jgi:hypothetical protein